MGTRFESIEEIKRKGTIWHVSRIGKNVDIKVFYREGITFKGTKLIKKNK